MDNQTIQKGLRAKLNRIVKNGLAHVQRNNKLDTLNAWVASGVDETTADGYYATLTPEKQEKERAMFWSYEVQLHIDWFNNLCEGDPPNIGGVLNPLSQEAYERVCSHMAEYIKYHAGLPHDLTKLA